MADHARLLDVEGLQGLISVLVAHGYTVVAPTVREGAIVHGSVTSVDELPRGWGDDGVAVGEQDADEPLEPLDIEQACVVCHRFLLRIAPSLPEK